MGPLQPDTSELVLGLVLFFSMFGLLGLVLLPRIERVLAARREAIEGPMERAQEIAARSRETLAELREQQLAAQREAARIRQEATDRGAEVIAAARVEGQRRREQLLGSARELIAADRERAEAELRAELGELATELAGRIVGEPLEGFVRQRGTVDRFFAELA